MDPEKTIACDQIDVCGDELRVLGRKIWKFAEPGGQGEKTFKTLVRFFQKKDFEVTSHLAGLRYAFKAEFGLGEPGGKRRPNVALVCQFDAVRGKGHQYGKNLEVELTAAAALGLQAVLRCSGARIGRITVIGCPNSEAGGMASLVNRKVFKEIDVALSAAPGPRTDWCPVYLGRKTFRVTYKGSDAHEDSSTMGTNPLAAAVLSLGNIQSIQQHFCNGWIVDGTIARGGVKASEKIVDTEVVVRLEAPTNQEMKLMEKRIVPCLESAAKASGCHVEIGMAQKCYYCVVSNQLMSYLLQQNAYYCGVMSTPTKEKKKLPPIDVGNLSHVVPSIRPMYFIGTDSEVGTVEFKKAAVRRDAHVRTLAMGKAIAMTAVDILHSDKLLSEVKAELKKSLEEESVSFADFPTANEKPFMIAIPVPADTRTGWSKFY